MRKMKLVFVLLLMFFFIHESRATNDERQATSESGEEAGHVSQAESGGPNGEGHDTGTPLVYYLNWAGLIAMCVIVLGEFRNNKKEKKHQEDKENHEFYEAGSEKPEDLEHISRKPVFKPVLLILMAALIFFCEQLPVLSGFHENLAAGYFRIIFKIIAGVLLLSYGLSSMEEEHH